MYGSIADFSAGAAKYAGRVTRGRIFWVNGSSGSDSASGREDDPLATITQAISLCTDRADDTIIVMRDTTEAAFPVSIDKRDIHILAWDEPTRPGCDKHYISGGSAAVFEIGAQNVEIAGFDFAASNSYPGIQFAAGSYWNAAIHDNMFGRRGALQDGIITPTLQDQNSISIYDNVFEYMIARDGIRLVGATSWGYIGYPGHGNLFREVTEVCLNNVIGSVLCGIYDNMFALTASFSTGDAITTGGSGCIINGNVCVYRVETTWTNKPFSDSGNNHWGHNRRGDEVSGFPAL